MKNVLGLLFIFSCSVSSAATLEYTCFSVDDNEPYGIEKLAVSVVDGETLRIELDVLVDVVETYKLNPDYVSKTENRKKYLKFNVVNPNSRAYSEGPVTPFFVQEELLKGGYPLRKGGTGAFIKINWIKSSKYPTHP